MCRLRCWELQNRHRIRLESLYAKKFERDGLITRAHNELKFMKDHRGYKAQPTIVYLPANWYITQIFQLSGWVWSAEYVYCGGGISKDDSQSRLPINSCFRKRSPTHATQQASNSCSKPILWVRVKLHLVGDPWFPASTAFTGEQILRNRTVHCNWITTIVTILFLNVRDHSQT